MHPIEIHWNNSVIDLNIPYLSSHLLASIKTQFLKLRLLSILVKIFCYVPPFQVLEKFFLHLDTHSIPCVAHPRKAPWAQSVWIERMCIYFWGEKCFLKLQSIREGKGNCKKGLCESWGWLKEAWPAGSGRWLCPTTLPLWDLPGVLPPALGSPGKIETRTCRSKCTERPNK